MSTQPTTPAVHSQGLSSLAATFVGRRNRPHLKIRDVDRCGRTATVFVLDGDGVARAEVPLYVPEDGDYQCHRVTLWSNEPGTRYDGDWAVGKVYRLLSDERALKLVA
jgi:hypothetical protein